MLETPKEIFEREVAQFPDSVRRISFDQNAAYLTSYPIAASRYSYQRGLSFAGRRYASDTASEFVHKHEKLVDCRLDSTDPSVMWAKSAKGILRLTANNRRLIEGMGTVQRIVAISEAMRFVSGTRPYGQAATVVVRLWRSPSRVRPRRGCR